MKFKRFMVLICASMLFTGCTWSNREHLDELKEKAEETKAKKAQEETEETTTEDITETAENEDMLYLGDIPLISSEDSADGLDLYFQYDGDVDDENPFIDNLTLVNGSNKDTATDIYCSYSEFDESYQMVTDDDREYIYIDVALGNDYYDVYVFDITDDNAKFAGFFGHTNVYVEELDSGEDFSDPDNMLICNTEGVLGTCQCYDYYHIGEDGMPESNTNGATIFHVSSNNITSNESMELDIVDDEGNLTGDKMTVASGTTFVPVRTDQETWIDAEIDDGTVVRIYYEYDYDEYEYIINGKTSDEIFSGLEYVG